MNLAFWKPRLILRRGADGLAYLTRWGIRTRWFSIYIHRFDGPDPGHDLHDHPWAFTSYILRGGYTEQRNNIWTASAAAWYDVSHHFGGVKRGWMSRHYGFGARNHMPLDACHRITKVEPGTLTLVICGPVRCTWGFYAPYEFIEHNDYDHPDRSLVAEFPRGLNRSERAELT